VLAKPDRTVFEEVVTLAIAEKMVFGEDRSQADLPIKIFNLYKASDRAHSHRRWAAHADFGKSSGVDSIMPKYAQNATLPGYHAIGGRYDYDGSSISWMRSIEDANSIFCNKEFMATSDADGLEMGIHVEDVIDILTDERSIYERAGADGRRAVEVETTH
jgi:hypothetical protein